ncbi:MAG: fused MFS/spermidine synthase [Thermoanaerobaculia bacterium]
MRVSVKRAALLVLGSGFCALVYQVAWLRLFRLVFGASTAASAAVLAIFMGGLGLGGLWLGRRADAHRRPLALYGQLELGITLTAAVSPLLLTLVRDLYIGLGGTTRLGLAVGTPVRLVLSALVLAAPTLLMGGTLPAVARAVESESDSGRRDLAVLYGINTLGAVLGALATTFVILEALGTRKTIWAACAVNLVVALIALAWGGERGSSAPRERGKKAKAAKPAAPSEVGATAPAATEATAPAAGGQSEAPVPFILIAAGLAGFAFFLMELVWYRMLAPILGGSSYTLGLILAVALVGIGVGGLLYSLGGRARRPTLLAFAVTCALEAFFLLVPYALGDRVALLALFLRPFWSLGFGSLVSIWAVVTTIVVLPPALVAGYQFPLLVGLLGSGERNVGREVGLTYAANTLGAIVGSLAGGFGLLPLLSAPGTWKLSALLLLALLAAALFLAFRQGGFTWRRAALPVAAGLAGLLLAFSTGPTAAWRHTPIGAGRVALDFAGSNALHNFLNERRRSIVWEVDGVESSVALKRSDQYELMINGKSDGSALSDSPTQVMSVLIGAMLHPVPRRSLVIGLGTGSSAGWLAEVPGMERVDVVEIEPAVRRIAQAMAPVNRDVLHKPKVHIFVADGREFLPTTSETYDVIFSEPSNPYRAGISSLFTREFYQATTDRLGPGGIFLQWLQGYDIDTGVVRTAYATLRSVFPYVETWQVGRNDLLLVASRQPIVHDAQRVRARAAQEPFRSALRNTWGVEGAEGFYSGFVATPGFANAFEGVAAAELSTDDRPVIEFGFVRSLGRQGLFDINTLRQTALAMGVNHPPGLESAIDWPRVAELSATRNVLWGVPPALLTPADPGLDARVRARQAYAQGNFQAAQTAWASQAGEPISPFDVTMLAETLAQAGDPRAPQYIQALRGYSPGGAEAVLAQWAYIQGNQEQTAVHLENAFRACRTDPWVYIPLVKRAMQISAALGKQNPALGGRLFTALGEPFAVSLAEDLRLNARVELAGTTDFRGLCLQTIEPFEPWVLWEERFLTIREMCYQQTSDPRSKQATRDLEAFRAEAPLPLVPQPENATPGAPGGR